MTLMEEMNQKALQIEGCAGSCQHQGRQLPVEESREEATRHTGGQSVCPFRHPNDCSEQH